MNESQQLMLRAGMDEYQNASSSSMAPALLNTNNSTALEEDLTARNVIIISSYTLIIIISLCGNLLVCKIAFGGRKVGHRNTTNILIASLAISDIVMTAFNIPFNVARLLLSDWPFGSILCVMVPLIQITCVYVSTFTMTLIAIHRNWSLTKKSSSNCNHSKYKILSAILIIWLLAFILSLPHSVYNEIKQVHFNGRMLTRCRVTYPALGINFRLLLSVEIFLTQYLGPLLLTTLLYIKIGAIVSKQGKVSVSACNIRRRLQSEAKRRRILMLALVVIVFAVCCYNPFIYCWRDDTFRVGAQKLLLFTTINCTANNSSGIYGAKQLPEPSAAGPPIDGSVKYRYNDSEQRRYPQSCHLNNNNTIITNGSIDASNGQLVQEKQYWMPKVDNRSITIV